MTKPDAALPTGTADYPGGEAFDEGIAAPGAPRALYRELMKTLGERDLAELTRTVESGVAARGLDFGAGNPLAVDPVPRLLGEDEWRSLAAGVEQRVKALNSFLLDVYSEQRIFAAGRVPWRLLDTSPGYEPRLRGLYDPAAGPPAAVAGLDLVKDPGGSPLVLEDNLRMPSGSAYAVAVRELVGEALEVRGLDPLPQPGLAPFLGPAIEAARPEGSDGLAAILSDGPEAGAWFEQQALSRALDLPIVTLAELEGSGGRLFARDGRDRRPIAVLYRRLDAERLTGPEGEVTDLGEVLLPALESGRLHCLNGFGTGIADDKLAHAYVEQMIDFYLGEEPLLRSARTLDLGDPAGLAEARERIDEMVVKPRDGFGGAGVAIVSRADPEERSEAVERIEREPGRWVAQEEVPISTHPTICGRRLRPRRVDLRPFAVSRRNDVQVIPGGLTRFARGAGELVVNSSRGGGCKDTWVVGR